MEVGNEFDVPAQLDKRGGCPVRGLGDLPYFRGKLEALLDEGRYVRRQADSCERFNHDALDSTSVAGRQENATRDV